MKLIGRFINNTQEFEDEIKKAEELGIDPPKTEYTDIEFHCRREDIAAFNESTDDGYWRVFTRFGYDFTISKESLSKEELIKMFGMFDKEKLN